MAHIHHLLPSYISQHTQTFLSALNIIFWKFASLTTCSVAYSLTLFTKFSSQEATFTFYFIFSATSQKSVFRRNVFLAKLSIFQRQLDCQVELHSDFTDIHAGPKFIKNTVVQGMSKTLGPTACKITHQNQSNIFMDQQKFQPSKMAFYPTIE